MQNAFKKYKECVNIFLYRYVETCDQQRVPYRPTYIYLSNAFLLTPPVHSGWFMEGPSTKAGDCNRVRIREKNTPLKYARVISPRYFFTTCCLLCELFCEFTFVSFSRIISQVATNAYYSLSLDAKRRNPRITIRAALPNHPCAWCMTQKYDTPNWHLCIRHFKISSRTWARRPRRMCRTQTKAAWYNMTWDSFLRDRCTVVGRSWVDTIQFVQL